MIQVNQPSNRLITSIEKSVGKDFKNLCPRITPNQIGQCCAMSGTNSVRLFETGPSVLGTTAFPNRRRSNRALEKRLRVQLDF